MECHNYLSSHRSSNQVVEPIHCLCHAVRVTVYMVSTEDSSTAVLTNSFGVVASCWLRPPIVELPHRPHTEHVARLNRNVVTTVGRKRTSLRKPIDQLVANGFPADCRLMPPETLVVMSLAERLRNGIYCDELRSFCSPHVR